MKKIIIIIALIPFTIYSSAQNIESFLDFRLGQSVSEVRNIVKNKYPSAEWDNNRCDINNVRIAGEYFNTLRLSFANNKVVSGRFSKHTTNLDFPSYDDAKRYVDNLWPQYVDMMSRLYSIYKSKYGSESYSSGISIVWRDSTGNSIKIELIPNIEDLVLTYAGSVSIYIEYELYSNIGNF